MSSNQITTIGIAGGSGSGKSTLARNLKFQLGDVCQIISHDSYYKNQDHLSLNERFKVNYDHPESLDSDLLAEHLRLLKKGQTIQVPLYDFATCTRTKEFQVVEPSRYIIVEGILLFADSNLANVFDYKIFVDVPADIRLIRRLHRDVAERGRTYEFGIDQYLEFTRPMHEQFVEPSKKLADILVPEGGENVEGIEKIVEKLR